MNVTLHRLTLTTGATASSGSVAIEKADQPGARLLSIHLLANQTLATTAVMVVSNRDTGQTILTATLTATAGWSRAPRQPLYTAADLIVAAATTAGNHEPFYIGGCAVDVSVTAAGLSKTGTLVILTG